MKIGYVLKYFPKLSETFVLNEMVALERAGADITVFALQASGGAPMAPALAELQAPVHYLDAKKDSQILDEIALHGEALHRIMISKLPWLLGELTADRQPLPLLRKVVELALHARSEGIEHLHAHFAGPAAELARLTAGLLDIPYSLTCHAKDIYHESVTRESFGRLTGEAQAVITVCEANREYILRELAPGLRSRLHVLYNGVDLTTFNPRDRAPVDPPLVLGVGRLVAKKGFIHLVEAVGKLERQGRRLRCVIAGEGRERASLEAAVRESRIQSVELLGATKHSVVAQLLRQATLVVLPCIVDAEGNRDALPTVLLEAMATGVPVVSTPVTGVAEIVEHGEHGLLVPQRDSAALAAAIETLLDAPDALAEMGSAARLRAEDRFDLDRNARILLGLLSRSAVREAVA